MGLNIKLFQTTTKNSYVLQCSKIVVFALVIFVLLIKRKLFFFLFFWTLLKAKIYFHLERQLHSNFVLLIRCMPFFFNNNSFHSTHISCKYVSFDCEANFIQNMFLMKLRFVHMFVCYYIV